MNATRTRVGTEARAWTGTTDSSASVPRRGRYVRGAYVDGGDAVLTISYPVIVSYFTVFYRAHSVTWTSMSAVSTRALTWAVRTGPRASTPRGASRESPCMQRKCICKIL